MKQEPRVQGFFFVPSWTRFLVRAGTEDGTADDMVLVVGVSAIVGNIDYEAVRGGVKNRLSRVDGKGLNDQECGVVVRINKQDPDFAGGVHVGKDDLRYGDRFLSGPVAQFAVLLLAW